MKTKLLLFTFGTLLLFAFTGETTVHVLSPLKGMDDDIRFKKTSREEIITKFGNEYTLRREYRTAETGEKKDSVLNRIIQDYPKAGISFMYAAWDTTKIVGITITKDFPSKTDKGIRAGISTIAQAQVVYGPAEWKYSDHFMFKEYPGISFVVPFDGKFPVSQATENAALKKKIAAIDIYFSSVNTNR
jgi:hypothetical protein